MRKALIGVAVLLIVFVALRAVVVPLARQRAGRRTQAPSTLALIPADAGKWVLVRNSYRRVPSELWPGNQSFLRDHLKEWNFPLERLRHFLGLRLMRSGEWCGGVRENGDWFLIGPKSRLRRQVNPDSLSINAGLLLEERGHLFFLSDAPHRTDQAWLSSLPVWAEVSDLLMAADYLSGAATGTGYALAGLHMMNGVLLGEGFAWDSDPSALDALWPIAQFADSSDTAGTGDWPLLRKTAPCLPDGKPLPPVSARTARRGQVREVDLTWNEGSTSARAFVRYKPDQED